MSWRILLLACVVVIAATCARHPRSSPVRGIPPSDSTVRVAIALASRATRVSGTGLFTIYDVERGIILAASRGDRVWNVTPSGADGITFSRSGERPVTVRRIASVRADANSDFVIHDGRRYRGTLTIRRVGDDLLVVNNLGMEEYLPGVVAMEIGNRRANEGEAVAAQVVAARSYTYSKLAARRRDQSRLYDMLADVSDQMYAGLDAELPLVNEKVRETEGEVLTYAGRVIEAVYSSSCGGATAAAGEVWSAGGTPYLQSVSDARPEGGLYCDSAPQFSWYTVLEGRQLVDVVDRYLRNYVQVSGTITSVSAVDEIARTPAGRLSKIRMLTNRGEFDVSGDNIRFVLRGETGGILRSNFVRVTSAVESGAGVVRLELAGQGFGHGVGMCQWGAIGRARAGQSYKQILSTYYTGTDLENVAALSEFAP